MNLNGLSIKDLAITISDYLRRNGVDTVLSGGACVSIYTENRFMSFDLDFVLISDDDQRKVKYLLADIGFYPENRYFKHDDTPYALDFVSPPPSVGSEPVKEVVEMKKRGKILRLLSPSDCVKDRLAAYYHWNDAPSLEQAIMICREHRVDLKEVERWSLHEGMSDKYQAFIQSLNFTE